jgi:hypothetical protein
VVEALAHAVDHVGEPRDPFASSSNEEEFERRRPILICDRAAGFFERFLHGN